MSIDSDVSRDDRPRAIAYLKDKYGSDKVCQIGTFGKYKVKSTIKFLLSSKNGFTSDFQNDITKVIPSQVEGREVTYELMEYFAKRLTDSIGPSPQYEGVFIDASDKDKEMIVKAYAVLEDLFVEHPQVKDGLLKFNETISNVGIHAGGIVISSKKIMDYIPLMKGSDAAVLQVCQADMSDITQYNMLKIDALGLKTLSQIDLCLKLANIDRSWLDIEETNDKKVYKFLREGHTFNVFQMHKGTPTAMIKNFKVKDLEGLTAVNAGNRPGPLAKGDNGKSMVDSFIENASTKEKISFDPRIDHILESTNMCLWYQEHCMNLGMTMAGYSLGGADIRIRKILGKKLLKKIPEIKNEFVYGKKSIYDENGNVIGISEEDSPNCIGAVANGYDEEVSLKIFDIMKEFSKYAFNKSHSAAYALLAYRTAWLSYYYPEEWYCACLSVDSTAGNSKELTIKTVSAAKKRGLNVLAPTINQSEKDFSVVTLESGLKGIIYGFRGVPRVGDKVIDAILHIREKCGNFVDFKDFLDKIYVHNDILREYVASVGATKFTNPVNKSHIENLIKTGLFDDLEENRHRLLNLFEGYNSLSKSKKEKLEDIDSIEKGTMYNEEEFTLRDKLQMEYETVGVYLSQHPLDNDEVFPYTDTSLLGNKSKLITTGIVRSCLKKTAKTGKTFYKITIEPRDGLEVSVTVFDNVYMKDPSIIKGLQGKKAKEGKEVVIVEGTWNPQFGITCRGLKRVSETIVDEEEFPEISEDVINPYAKTIEQEDIFS